MKTNEDELNYYTKNDSKPEMLSGVQTGNRIPNFNYYYY